MSQKFLYSPDAFFRHLASVSQNCVLKNSMSLASSAQPSVLLLPPPFARSSRAHGLAAAAPLPRCHSLQAGALQQPRTAVDRDSAVSREIGTAMSKCGQPRGICARVRRVIRPSQLPPPDRARVASLLFPAVDATFPPIALVSGPDPSPPLPFLHHQLQSIEINILYPQPTRLHQTQPGSVNQPLHQAKGPQRNLWQHPPHFLHGQHYRQLCGAFGACRIDLQLLLKHLGLQKENRRKCLVLRTGCDVSLNCQIRKNSITSLLPSSSGCRYQSPALDEIGGSRQSSCGKPPPSELT